MTAVAFAPNIDAARSDEFAPDINFIQTLGYFYPGDGGAIYQRVGVRPESRCLAI